VTAREPPWFLVCAVALIVAYGTRRTREVRLMS
jgi:hypothetical protein